MLLESKAEVRDEFAEVYGGKKLGGQKSRYKKKHDVGSLTRSLDSSETKVSVQDGFSGSDLSHDAVLELVGKLPESKAEVYDEFTEIDAEEEDSYSRPKRSAEMYVCSGYVSLFTLI